MSVWQGVAGAVIPSIRVYARASNIIIGDLR